MWVGFPENMSSMYFLHFHQFGILLSNKGAVFTGYGKDGKTGKMENAMLSEYRVLIFLFSDISH